MFIPSPAVLRRLVALRSGSPWREAQALMDALSVAGFDAPVSESPRNDRADDPTIVHEFTQTLMDGDEGVAMTYLVGKADRVIGSPHLTWLVGAITQPEDVQGLAEQMLGRLAETLGHAHATLNRCEEWIAAKCPQDAAVVHACWSIRPAAEAGPLNAQEYRAALNALDNPVTVDFSVTENTLLISLTVN
jgi:hypothetical protein